MTSLARLVFVDALRSDSHFITDEDQRLTLAYESLQHVPRNLVDDFGNFVRTLDISHNRFRQLDFLAEFDNLTSLIVDHNHVDSEVVLPALPNLRLLWLNHNKVRQLFPFVRNLQRSCPRLHHLSLMGNEAAPSYLNGGTYYEHLQYRLFVISWFPELTHLDDRAVTADQRAESRRLFQRPFLERVSSNHTFLRGFQDKFSVLLNGCEKLFLSGRPNSIV